jgi:hypothetical protein
VGGMPTPHNDGDIMKYINLSLLKQNTVKLSDILSFYSTGSIGDLCSIFKLAVYYCIEL